MFKTGYVCDPRYANHEVPPGHPERPERIETLLDLMRRYARDGIVSVAPRAATVEEISANHDRRYVDQVRATAGKPIFVFDSDTTAYAESYETALLAAGGVLELIDHVMAGKVQNGFAMVRPPGHHAEADRAMGFCFFNNVAIGARYLKSRHGLERILIVDWDVHHGNGTQDAFYDDPRVLFISLHQRHHYPGTGHVDEVGVGAGAGYTVNVPLPVGAGDGAATAVFETLVEPLLRAYRPQLLLASCGFDSIAGDPLGGLRLSREAYRWMASRLVALGREVAAVGPVCTLEGGYEPALVADAVVATLEGLRGDPVPILGHPAGREEAAAVAATRQALAPHWGGVLG